MKLKLLFFAIILFALLSGCIKETPSLGEPGGIQIVQPGVEEAEKVAGQEEAEKLVEEGIIVTTDEFEYHHAETMDYYIFNGLSQKIFVLKGQHNLNFIEQKQGDGSWKRFGLTMLPEEPPPTGWEPYESISPGEKKSYNKWMGWLITEAGEQIDFVPGTYRLVIEYKLNKEDKEFLEAESNMFEIIEQPEGEGVEEWWEEEEGEEFEEIEEEIEYDFEDLVPNENIKFRGAVGDGIGRDEPWPGKDFPESEGYVARHLAYAKSLGVNYISLWAYYDFDVSTYELYKKHDRDKLLRIIEMAHDLNLKVLLYPFAEAWVGHEVEGVEFEGVDDTQAFLDKITLICKEWAEFAEEHDVEMYGLLEKPESFLRSEGESSVDSKGVNTIEALNAWYKKMLPEIREIFSGEVIAITSLDATPIGYDYIFLPYCGLPPGIPVDEHAQVTIESAGVVTTWTGPKDFKQFKELANQFIPIANNIKENTNAKGIIFNEIWVDAIGNLAYHPRTKADENTELEREWFDNVAHAFDILLEETKSQIAGYFFIGVFEEDPAIEKVIKKHYLKQ